MCEPTVGEAIGGVFRDPYGALVRRWNWKSATFSSLVRAYLFLAFSVKAGWGTAVGVAGAEFVLRFVLAGVQGAFTQALRKARPAWLSMATVLVVLPAVGQMAEYGMHVGLGTPNLKRSAAVSTGLAAVATLFNWYAMRRGALVVGEGGGTVASDVKALPGLIAGFVMAVPVAAWRFCGRAANKFR